MYIIVYRNDHPILIIHEVKIGGLARSKGLRSTFNRVGIVAV